MRQTPWIDVLWVHDAGDLFASLRSELAPATSPNIGLEDKRQRDISRVGAAALVCLRRLRNIKDGKTEKVRHDEKWFLGKDLDNYSAIIEDVPEEEIRRDHERVERAIRGRILLREDLPSQQELDEVIGELETLLRKYHQPVDDR
jgi:hypothetical protein